MDAKIHSIDIDGRDIQALIFKKLAPACKGERLSHAILALLTYSVILMKPDIEIADLQDTVMSTSEFMMLKLATPEELGGVQ